MTSFVILDEKAIQEHNHFELLAKKKKKEKEDKFYIIHETKGQS